MSHLTVIPGGQIAAQQLFNAFPNREAWLNAAMERFRPEFRDAGLDIPVVRMATGFTGAGRGVVGSKNVRLGECWSSGASADKATEIFIHPMLADPVEVLRVLKHELIHAALYSVNLKHGHGKLFKAAARALGMEPNRFTPWTPEGKARAESIAEALGPFPHAALDALRRPTKKQNTRMLKASCNECAFIVRVTKGACDEHGAPRCANADHGAMNVAGWSTDESDGAEIRIAAAH